MKSEGLAGLTTVSVDWEEPAVIILDQTQLPNREAYLRLYTPEEIWEAIYHLKVRGAPAIGVAAAYGMAVCAQQFGEQSFSVFFQKFTEVKKYPVSYTHLDVYKRQIKVPTMWRWVTKRFDPSEKGELMGWN